MQIIDCIEFNERFRYSDVIADAAFLSMDPRFPQQPRPFLRLRRSVLP
ncbi:MAG: hypothetical protein QY316_00440 [Thermodesulfobacteriota bacterium]|nr:MAG: hypothetical protein QY316_00440 [Thermodesulfobacteriota bacterium]